MVGKKEETYDILKKMYVERQDGITSEEIADKINSNRSNISTYLNKLCTDGIVKKIKSRPVKFIPMGIQEYNKTKESNDAFYSLIGKTHSLKDIVEKCKAAILYPPYGLHTILYGETGVGKSMIAKYMYNYSIERGIRTDKFPFIIFNCADYANNPQLLMGHIFGVEKGAYTGAESSRIGLLEAANGGILFLDEVHRLPPEGQEMLFTFIDKGSFKKMGNATKEIKSEVLIIAATTENPNSTLLDTFKRRIPMTIEIPALRDRTFVERIELIKSFFRAEAKRINCPIKVHSQIINSLLLYNCKNNVGQLQSDIKLASANAYLNYVKDNKKMLDIRLEYFNKNINDFEFDYKEKYSELRMLTIKNLDYYIFNPSAEEEAFTLNSEEKNGIYGSIGSKNIKQNFFIEEIFEDKKFVDICEIIKKIIYKDLSIILDESQFTYLSIYLKNIIDKKSNVSSLDVNKIRQENRDEFKTALKIINVIENEYEIYLSLEDVAHITLFIIKDRETNYNKIDNNINIIVAMHGINTASSMTKAVEKIIGESNNLYAFDMDLDKSYTEVVNEFKLLIGNIDKSKDVIFFTDMGSLTSFYNIIKCEVNTNIRSIPMVTTLLVLEAVQKANIGLSSLEVYNSLVYIQNYSITSNDDLIKNSLNNIIVIGYKDYENMDMYIRKHLKNALSNYIKEVEIIYLPYKSKKDLNLNLNKLMSNNNLIAFINDFDPETSGVEYIVKSEIYKDETIDWLKDLIKINKGYYEIAETLKISLSHVNYSRLFNDIKLVIDCSFKKLNIKKQYDSIIGLIMHIAFMVDELSGKTRNIDYNEYDDNIYDNDNIQLSIIKEYMKILENNYNIRINKKECRKILEMVLS